MRRRLMIMGSVVAIIVIVAIILSSLDLSATRLYHGKSVSAWARLAYSGDQQAVAEIKEIGANAVPELTRMLQAKDPWYKRAFWSARTRLPVKARANLTRKIGFPEAGSMRGAAVKSLGIIGPAADSAIPRMAKLLYDNDHQLTFETAAAMSHMGEASVPPLVEALKNPDPGRRRSFVYALGELGTNAQAAVPALIRMLNDPDDGVHAGASYALTSIGVPGLNELTEIVNSGKGNARSFAVKELLLYNHSPYSRSVVPAIVQMTQDTNASTRLEAIQALTSMRIMSRAATTALTNALNDSSVEVRLVAVAALTPATYKRDLAIPSLVAALSDASPKVREAAAHALAEFGPAATNAVPGLNRLAQDNDASVQTAAKAALAKIQ